jgi:hypothetical protein
LGRACEGGNCNGKTFQGGGRKSGDWLLALSWYKVYQVRFAWSKGKGEGRGAEEL